MRIRSIVGRFVPRKVQSNPTAAAQPEPQAKPYVATKPADDNDVFSVPLSAARQAMAGKAAAPAQPLQQVFARAYTRQETNLVERMKLLANALAGEKVEIVEGDQWQYSPEKNTLTYPKKNALAHGVPYNLGAVCHAIARRRYARKADAATAQSEGSVVLWHLLDGLRTGNILAARYAGASPLLAQMYQEHAARAAGGQPFEQYMAACLAWRLGDRSLADQLDPDVMKIFVSTFKDLRRVMALPSTFEPLFGDLSKQQASLEAKRAEAIIRERIWPKVKKLFDDQQPPPMGNSPFGGKGGTGGDDELPPAEGSGAGGEPGDDSADGDPASGDPGNMPPNPNSNVFNPNSGDVAKEAEDLAKQAEENAPPKKPEPPPAKKSQPQKPKQKRRPPPLKGGAYLQHNSSGAIRYMPLVGEDAVGDYTYFRTQQQKPINLLQRELETLFEKERMPSYDGYFRSGKFDLRKAINSQFREAATGVRDPKVFLRREIPEERNVAFIVAADSSGSMSSGSRMHNLHRAMPLIMEPARRLGIPVGLLKYDSDVEILAQIGDTVDDSQCNALLQTLYPSGSTNTLLALGAIEHMATRTDVDEIYAMFVTDGGGDQQLPREIKALAERDPRVRIIGVGIGEGCEEVAALYPQHRAVSDIDSLPAALGSLLLEAQRGDLRK